MGISDLISGFISTPGKVISYVQANVLKSPRPLKRPREDSTDGEERDQRVARLKLSHPEAEAKAASRLGNLSGNTFHHQSDARIVAGEVVSPPAPWLQKQKQAQAQPQRALPGAIYSTSPGFVKQPGAPAAPAQPLELWGSIRHRRHGPQTGFRPFTRRAIDAQPASSPILVSILLVLRRDEPNCNAHLRALSPNSTGDSAMLTRQPRAMQSLRRCIKWAWSVQAVLPHSKEDGLLCQRRHFSYEQGFLTLTLCCGRLPVERTGRGRGSWRS